MPKLPQVVVSSPTARPFYNNCNCPSDSAVFAWQHDGDRATLFEVPAWLYFFELPDNNAVCFNPYGAGNVVMLNAAAQALLQQFAVPQSLQAIGTQQSEAQLALQQLVEQGLLVPQGQTQPRLTTRGQALAAWLHVTNDCNLRCDYCYVSKSEERMSAETGERAIAAVVNSAVRHGFTAVELKYAGGEATLNLSLVRLLHECALSECAAHGLDLTETVLSNGVALSHATLTFLRDNGIGLMISLDGVGETHDAQRRFADGRGSFIHVKKSIDRAIALGIRPNISVTVTARNADKLADVVHFAIDRDVHFKLAFFRENNCASAYTDLAADNERVIAGMQAALRVIEQRLPQYRLIDSLVDLSSFERPHEHVCGAGRSYMVVDQYGNVAACQMEIERPITSIFARDPLGELRTASTGFQNRPVSEKTGCRDCTWRFWCAGGCPMLTYRATGRNDVKSPYCDVYKALYPEVIRLEGLRMLKWQQEPLTV